MTDSFEPLADVDTYQRLLATLPGFVGREVEMIWVSTRGPSAIARGTLALIDDPEHPTAIGCKLGNEVQFWFRRHEVFGVDPFEFDASRCLPSAAES
jgi:hypothetical protein